MQRSERGWLPPSTIALVEQALGDYDAAFRWLERAVRDPATFCVSSCRSKGCSGSSGRATIMPSSMIHGGTSFVRRVGTVGSAPN